MIPNKVHANLTHGSKDAWNFIPHKEKASVFGSARNKPKHKPPFVSKVNKSGIELLHQHLSIYEYDNSEDNSTYEESAEK